MQWRQCLLWQSAGWLRRWACASVCPALVPILVGNDTKRPSYVPLHLACRGAQAGAVHRVSGAGPAAQVVRQARAGGGDGSAAGGAHHRHHGALRWGWQAGRQAGLVEALLCLAMMVYLGQQQHCACELALLKQMPKYQRVWPVPLCTRGPCCRRGQDHTAEHAGWQGTGVWHPGRLHLCQWPARQAGAVQAGDGFCTAGGWPQLTVQRSESAAFMCC